MYLVVALLQILLSGSFVNSSDIDMPKWASWLAANGYTNKAGWDKLMEGIKVCRMFMILVGHELWWAMVFDLQAMYGDSSRIPLHYSLYCDARMSVYRWRVSLLTGYIQPTARCTVLKWLTLDLAIESVAPGINHFATALVAGQLLCQSQSAYIYAKD